MNPDARLLLNEAIPLDLTVDTLAAELVELQAIGMGGAYVRLPDGAPIRNIEIVEHGEEISYFILTDGMHIRLPDKPST